MDTYPQRYTGPYVANALGSAGHMAAEHLVGAGCRHPVFFNASTSMSGFSSFQHLLKGFREGLHAAGRILPDHAIVNADWTIEGGIAGYTDLLARGQPFDGIFCVNDLCALGVIEAAERSGRRVGRDLAVMGIDNLEMAGVSRISLTSIDQPYDRIIELAARSLIESIERSEQPTIRKRLKPSLVVRQSSSLL